MNKYTLVVTVLGMLELVLGYGVPVPCPTDSNHPTTELPVPLPTTVVPEESGTRAATEWRDPRDPDGDSIIGLAGVDYPVLAAIPRTNFVCSTTNQGPGYYADPESHCQVFHVCLETGGHVSFLCPNGTMFNDVFSVCDWWYNVRCGVDDATTSSAPDDPSPEGIDVTSVLPPLVELQVSGGPSSNFFAAHSSLRHITN